MLMHERIAVTRYELPQCARGSQARLAVLLLALRGGATTLKAGMRIGFIHPSSPGRRVYGRRRKSRRGCPEAPSADPSGDAAASGLLTDLNGHPRVVRGTVDMGACEFTPALHISTGLRGGS